MQLLNFDKNIDLLSIDKDMPPFSLELVLDIDSCSYLQKRFDFIEVSNVYLTANIKKISKYSDYLKDLRLVDYKVRILNTGTEAVTRVSIESTDSQGKNWFTIGVSPNIIDASFKALIDSLDYKLFKDNAPASA